MFPNTDAISERRQRLKQINAGIFALLDERMKLLIEINSLRHQSSRDLEKLSLEAEEILVKVNSDLDTQKSDAALEQLNLIWGKMIELEGKINESDPI